MPLGPVEYYSKSSMKYYSKSSTFSFSSTTRLLSPIFSTPTSLLKTHIPNHELISTPAPTAFVFRAPDIVAEDDDSAEMKVCHFGWRDAEGGQMGVVGEMQECGMCCADEDSGR
ncbi:MAG: hypothetical protein Q9172_000374 [Xanthocarpia lactea]